MFDLEQDPLEQGYAPNSYDVVVGSLVVHATAELEKTLRRIRKVLKSGGFLVIGEGSHNCTTGGFIFGPLAGWWLGVDEGRTLTPFVSRQEWTRLLRKTGFSGVDSITPQEQEDVYGVNVWVTQAIDEEVQFLREPLSSSPDTNKIDELVIVGGKTPKTVPIVQGLQSLLVDYTVKTYVFETLAVVDFNLVGATSTVVSLADLDGAVFDDIQRDTWQGLKQMFEVGKTLLWLTSGREAEQSYANMMVGFGRTAMLETPGLRLQFLDVPDATRVDIRRVAEATLRLQVEFPENRSDILWTVESELLLDAAGRSNVARLREISEPNDRYNSVFRPISHEVDIGSSAVQLQCSPTRPFVLKKLSPYGEASESSAPTIQLRITHSLLYANRTTLGFKYIIIGEAKGQPSTYMALVTSLTSILSIRAEDAIPIELAGVSPATILASAAAYVTAEAICDPMFSGDTVAVHNAPSHLSKAIDFRSAEKGVSVSYTTDSSVPAYLSRAQASRLIPAGTRALICLSERGSENETTMIDLVSPHVRKETAHTLYAIDGTPSTVEPGDTLGQLAKKACSYAQVRSEEASDAAIIAVPLEDIKGQYVGSFDRSTVVDWSKKPGQLAEISRLDSTQIFKGDKTYWIVGLSGVLGLSLCDWMITRGARYLVLTSRHPKISPDWVEAHAANGVHVAIMPWYVFVLSCTEEYI